MQSVKISRRESAALMNSLTAGVVPRIGLRHIAVGRKNEVNAFLHDLATIEDGGASFRLVSGKYGSGKSFLLQMIRNNAMERSFVVADADLSPERRLTGTKGQGLATYRELMQHLSTLTRPEGSALESVLQKWISSLQTNITKARGFRPGAPEIVDAVSVEISEVLTDLSEMVYGFAFSSVIEAYWRGMKTGNEDLKQASLRWLRGEFNTKTEARQYLSVDRIIDDQSWYEFLKLFAKFVAKTGYKGLLVFLDEGVNLYKITHKQARDSNYEKILTIFNDTMQGKAQYIGVFLSGTPQFIYDERRGLFNYEALRSRLAANRFGAQGFVDYTSPVIKLDQLSAEEIYLLLERLCELHGAYYSYSCPFGEKELTSFINTVAARLGADQLLTPREITRDFLGLLNILHQNPDLTFDMLIAEKGFSVKSAELNPEEASEKDLFAEFDI
ncbi:ATP-binding protein [Methanosarcina barkeri]|uniref:Putative ATP n=1 Tax=Methanosarcina barkeri 227 TaxID=1434106 RepID=A0A0E3R1F7_METBA|nr:ATP-binding protein [Methanosarcina barkeri]AKB57970.1 putative ATP [Methanosarcina barkeri 227]